MDKLQMQSKNLVDENISKIAELFPNCITEGQDENGKLTKLVDFDLLKQELSKDIVEGNDERYTLNWAGKKQAILTANSPINATLRPCREESVDFDNTKNLYIEGDNLDVLKLLRETYLGKVKMIYIDPPYNTGKDFLYNDNFATSAVDYSRASKSCDAQGNKMFQNNQSNGRFHSDWLSMMYSRLKVARDLLSKDGVIFISIDDNEMDNLKKVTDEIFGAGNYLTTFTIQVRYADKSLNEEKCFKPLVEYILAYAKDIDLFIPNQPTEEYGLEKFVYNINELTRGEIVDINGNKVEIFKPGQWQIVRQVEGSLKSLKETWISGSVYTTMSYGKVFQKIVEPRVEVDGLGCLYKVYGRGDDGLGYRYYTGPQKVGSSRGKMYSGVPLERAEEIRKGRVSIRKKPIPNFYDFSADFGNIRHEGEMPFSSGKKPVKLLKQLINYIPDRNGIVMDFFSGSASTAHAVMQLNAEDGGNRKFIMVQMPELCNEKADAYKAGFKNICEIGKERIRRAGQNIAMDLAGKELMKRQTDIMDVLNSNPNTIQAVSIVKENKIGESSGKCTVDIGFRVLKLDGSCMKDVYYNPHNLKQDLLSQLEDNIKEDRTAEDLLFQVMLDMGVLLSSEIKVLDIQGKKVFNVNDGNLVCCFDKNLTDDVVTEIAKLQPLYAVFRDSSMSSDSVAVNFDQIFETFSPTTTRKII